MTQTETEEILIQAAETGEWVELKTKDGIQDRGKVLYVRRSIGEVDYPGSRAQINFHYSNGEMFRSDVSWIGNPADIDPSIERWVVYIEDTTRPKITEKWFGWKEYDVEEITNIRRIEPENQGTPRNQGAGK